jgi:choline transport protein
MASSPSKSSGIEMNVVPTRSTDRQDDLALARLGKKAVLKVYLLSF